MLAFWTTEPHITESPIIEVVFTYELHKPPVNKELCNTSSYELAIRHIECNVNANFSRVWVQTNSDNINNFGSCSGCIFIPKHYFEMLKGKHTKKISPILIQAQTQATLQHTQRI